MKILTQLGVFSRNLIGHELIHIDLFKSNFYQTEKSSRSLASCKNLIKTGRAKSHQLAAQIGVAIKIVSRSTLCPVRVNSLKKQGSEAWSNSSD